jgi:hypothetical protein
LLVYGDAWFRQGPNPEECEPRLPSGLVNQVANLEVTGNNRQPSLALAA